MLLSLMIFRVARPHLRRVVFTGLVVALSNVATALEESPTQPAENPSITTEEVREEAGQNCEWACLKWTKMCNVDPRGVYKCRRSCANFGEICE